MRFEIAVLCLFLPASVWGGEKWTIKDYEQWTAAETDRILNDSPWVKHAQAYLGTTDEDARTYPVEAPPPPGIHGQGAPDNNWDGGVGRMKRGSDPTLPVTVRWDSALPVREALLRSQGPELRDTANTISKPDKYYIITVFGLAQARKHSSHAPGEDENQAEFETQRTRQGLVNEARLMRKDKKPIVPEDARIDPATGAVQIYFPKTDPITMSDKEVVFGTVFGSIRLTQKFRLKDMTYRGKLEL